MNSTTTDKIQKIAEHIRANVLDPVEKEKEQILTEARQEKARIIAEAEKEAMEIIEAAQKHAKELNASVETALRIAAKQAIPVLKLSIEREVMKQTIIEPATRILNKRDILKEIIIEIVKKYSENNFSGDIEILVSQEKKNELVTYIKSATFNKIKAGLSLTEEIGLKGCKIIFKEQRIVLDFSTDSITELLFRYVRPELRSYLFQNA